MFFQEFIQNRYSQPVQNLYTRATTIIGQLNPVEIVTPLDLPEIKQDWITKAENGELTNPEFYYDALRLHEAAQSATELQGLYLTLSKALVRPPLTDYESLMVESFLSSLQDACQTSIMAGAILAEDDRITSCISALKYDRPDPSSLYAAYKLAEQLPDSTTHSPQAISDSQYNLLRRLKFNASEIARQFTWAMTELINSEGWPHISDQTPSQTDQTQSHNLSQTWPCIITKNASAIDVRLHTEHGHPAVIIPEDRQLDGLELVRLTGHEIVCHWRDLVLSRQLGLSKSDDERMHEGHATISDADFHQRFGTKNYTPAPWYIIAIDLASRGANFAEVATKLHRLDPDATLKAIWTRTYRIFRGSTASTKDNTRGYSFNKDLAYFEGYRLAQQYPRHALVGSVLPAGLFDIFAQTGAAPTAPTPDIMSLLVKKLTN